MFAILKDQRVIARLVVAKSHSLDANPEVIRHNDMFIYNCITKRGEPPNIEEPEEPEEPYTSQPRGQGAKHASSIGPMSVKDLTWNSNRRSGTPDIQRDLQNWEIQAPHGSAWFHAFLDERPVLAFQGVSSKWVSFPSVFGPVGDPTFPWL